MRGKGTLTPEEQTVYQMWVLLKEHNFKPWEHDTTYEEGEHILKQEDKADILTLDKFEDRAQERERKKQESLAKLKKRK